MDDPGTRLWRRESLSEVAGPFFFFYFYHCHPGYDDMTTYALDALNDGFPTNDIHTKHLMLPTRQPVHSIRWVEMYFFRIMIARGIANTTGTRITGMASQCYPGPMRHARCATTGNRKRRGRDTGRGGR